MRTMKSLTWIAGATLAIAFALVAVAQAADDPKAAATTHDFVGSKACKTCHMGAKNGTIFEIWEKSAHAQATAKLPEANQKDPKCLGCHATGFGKAGGFDPAAPAATSAALQGVGCESCHGAGKDYKAMSVMKDPAKAKEMGLIMPTADLCKGCHEGAVPEGHKALPKFDFATAKPKIEHHIPKTP